jgi:hypothetical protein
MNTLPSEFLCPVFGFTCAESGRTVCALRPASRQTRVIAARFRFHTIVVPGGDTSASLLRALDACPPELRVIEHLFVCNRPGSGLRAQASPDEDRRVAALLTQLLRAAAPHPRGLTFLTRSRAFAQAMGRIPQGAASRAWRRS